MFSQACFDTSTTAMSSGLALPTTASKNTMSSSVTNNNAPLPAKKAGNNDYRPKANHKVDDVVAVYTATPITLMKITGAEYDEEGRCWKYKGNLWDTKVEVAAPELALMEVKYRPDQKVLFKIKDATVEGEVESVLLDENGDTCYRIRATGTFIVLEESVGGLAN